MDLCMEGFGTGIESLRKLASSAMSESVRTQAASRLADLVDVIRVSDHLRAVKEENAALREQLAALSGSRQVMPAIDVSQTVEVGTPSEDALPST